MSAWPATNPGKRGTETCWASEHSRRVLDRKAGERGERILIRGVRQRPERAQRLLRLLAREARGVLEAAGGFDRRHHQLELLEPPLFDRAADGRALCFVAALERVDQRQGRFAFGQIVAEVFEIGRASCRE